MGGVRYSLSRATEPDEALLRFWEEVQLLLNVREDSFLPHLTSPHISSHLVLVSLPLSQTPEKEVSTTLLIFPELELFGNYELFEAYCEWCVLRILPLRFSSHFTRALPSSVSPTP